MKDFRSDEFFYTLRVNGTLMLMMPDNGRGTVLRFFFTDRHPIKAWPPEPFAFSHLPQEPAHQSSRAKHATMPRRRYATGVDGNLVCRIPIQKAWGRTEEILHVSTIKCP